MYYLEKIFDELPFDGYVTNTVRYVLESAKKKELKRKGLVYTAKFEECDAQIRERAAIEGWRLYSDGAFAKIYDREPHIRLLMNAYEMYGASKKQVRNHCLLFGEPASAKTSIFAAFKELWGERVHILDCVTMTKAGFENFILFNESLPDVLCLEEIEKVDQNCLGSLLSLMDVRAEVQKTNHRIGHKVRSCPILVWASCNDMEKLKAHKSGALYSRFVHEIYCQKPSEETLKRILNDRVVAMSGNLEWTNRVLELSKQLGVTDPRKIIGFLDGRERLMTGEFQRDVNSTHKRG